MLAAHFPTARSRCDLDHMIKSSSSRNLLRRNGSYSSSSSGGSITSSSTLRHRGSKKKRESVHLNEDEKKHHHHHPEEARAYAAVSLLYALGQSLYDIFSSQQAKSSTLRFKNAYLAAYAYAILVSAYPMAKALSSPYVGHLSDKIGRKSVLVATLVATGLCLACCGSAESYWGVLVARFATGCVANGGLLTARATDIAADHAQRTRLFSLFTTAWAIARVGAAVLVRLLTLDVARACKFAAWCEIAAAVIALIGFRGIYPREIDTKQKQTLPTANKPSFRNLAREMLSERLALCLFATSMLTPRVDATAFVSRRFGDEGLAQSVGYLKAVEAVAVVTVGLTPVSKRLSKFFGEAGAAVLAALAVALGWIGVAYAPNILALYILVAIRAACAAVYDPAARSLVWARAADRKDKTPGSVAGLQQSLKGATQVFSSWLGAYLTTLSVSAPLAISAVAMVANALSVAFVEKRHPLSNSPNNKHHQQQQQQQQQRQDNDIFDDHLRESFRNKGKDVIIHERGREFLIKKRDQHLAVSPVREVREEEDEFEEIDDDVSSWSIKNERNTLNSISLQKEGKLVRLICCGECVTETVWSVAQVVEWLKNRGQDQAAALACKNGVDGTALEIAQSADELREAFEGKVSLLVCRAILCAFQKQLSDKHGGDAALAASGKVAALELRRTITHCPELIVVAPDRACIQTALLAFRSMSNSYNRRCIVAHDSLANGGISSESFDILQLEYGQAVDFSLVDLEEINARNGIIDLQRRVFALLAFLRARTESTLALVATASILDALQAALASATFDLTLPSSDDSQYHRKNAPTATKIPHALDGINTTTAAWTPVRPGHLRDIYLNNANIPLAIPRTISLTHSSVDEDGPESF